MNDYNQNWCNERHRKIDTRFKDVWDKLKTLEGRLWAIIVLLFMNLAGIFVSIAMKG